MERLLTTPSLSPSSLPRKASISLLYGYAGTACSLHCTMESNTRHVEMVRKGELPRKLLRATPRMVL